jgi:hypothetical protein
MTNSLINLRASLENAVDLIDESLLLPVEEVIHSDNFGLPKRQLDFTHAASLLDKCDSVDEQYQGSKPVIRIIHHFACSGGSIISKCLSAMPNVYLLSEVHPFTDLAMGKEKPKYSPSDITSLTKYAGIPKQTELAAKLFKKSIDEVNIHITKFGGVLILRDHTHSDYCVGEHIHNNTIVELLEDSYQIISLVTLRNPIDCYLSLLARGWVHFKPENFDEYCKRLLVFLNNFTKEQIVFYENFVQQTQQVVKEMCSKLEIPFDDSFEATFDVFSVTGDSGRKGAIVGARKRRDVSKVFEEEVENSAYFKKVCRLYSLNSEVNL